ncbi:MAG: hypothetical protein QOH13_514, partial [Thermoleophilaceae bacterium]|nr:hypothetical protein [Thermoleophilaceae bacterium]
MPAVRDARAADRRRPDRSARTRDAEAAIGRAGKLDALGQRLFDACDPREVADGVLRECRDEALHMRLDRSLAQPQRLRELGVDQLHELTIDEGGRGFSGAADERFQQRGPSGEMAPFRRRPGAGPDEPALVGRGQEAGSVGQVSPVATAELARLGGAASAAVVALAYPATALRDLRLRMAAAAGAGVATMPGVGVELRAVVGDHGHAAARRRPHGRRADPHLHVGAAVEQRVSERRDERAETVTERHEAGAPPAARGGAQAAHQPPAAGERADRLGHERLGAQIVAAPRVDSAD